MVGGYLATGEVDAPVADRVELRPGGGQRGLATAASE